MICPQRPPTQGNLKLLFDVDWVMAKDRNPGDLINSCRDCLSTQGKTIMELFGYSTSHHSFECEHGKFFILVW